MSKYFRVALITIAGFALCFPRISLAVTVDFGSTPSSLPFAQNGMTFTKVIANSPMSVTGFGTDMALVAGTNTIPIDVRAQLSPPGVFDLVSLDIEGLFRTWTIYASTGFKIPITATGTINFAGLPGWQEITS